MVKEKEVRRLDVTSPWGATAYVTEDRAETLKTRGWVLGKKNPQWEDPDGPFHQVRTATGPGATPDISALVEAAVAKALAGQQAPAEPARGQAKK